MKKINTVLSVCLAAVLSACAPGYQNPAQTNTDLASPISSAAQSQNAISNASVGAAAAIPGSLPSAATTGQSALAAATPALVNILSQQLGVSSQQAIGGAGAIFSIAKQGLPASDFGQISSVVPGMPQILAAAPRIASSSTGGLLGAAGSALGASSGLGQLANAAIAFQNLGLGAGMVNQFIPIMLQYVQNQGGSATMGLLQRVLLPQQ